jgi:hypothetical protein
MKSKNLKLLLLEDNDDEQYYIKKF